MKNITKTLLFDAGFIGTIGLVYALYRIPESLACFIISGLCLGLGIKMEASK